MDVKFRCHFVKGFREVGSVFMSAVLVDDEDHSLVFKHLARVIAVR